MQLPQFLQDFLAKGPVGAKKGLDAGATTFEHGIWALKWSSIGLAITSLLGDALTWVGLALLAYELGSGHSAEILACACHGLPRSYKRNVRIMQVRLGNRAQLPPPCRVNQCVPSST